MKRAAIAVLVLLALPACSSREPRRNPAHNGPHVGGRLVIGLTTEPRNLDPATFLMEAESLTMSFLGGALVAFSPEGKVVPWLATDWTVAPDGKRVTFHLRRGVRFHSGASLVARHWAASFERILDPATGSWERDLLGGVTAVRAPDDTTLVFDLERPNYSLLLTLADQSGFQPVDPAALARWGSEYGRHPSSVGPYRLKELRAGRPIILERNPEYAWAPPFVHQGPWYFREIEIRTLPEPAALLAAFESGEVSLLLDAGFPNWKRLSVSPDCQLLDVPGYRTAQLALNLERPLFADPRVRQAVQHAIDRQAIVDAAWEGHGAVGYAAVHPDAIGYLRDAERPPLARPYDLVAARRLLEEAGWHDADHDGVREREGHKLRARLATLASQTFPLMAELIQAQLREVGFEVVIEISEANAHYERLYGGDFDLGVDGLGWVGDATDPMTILLASSQIGVNGNASRYRSPEMDELLRKARETTSEADHRQALTDAQRLFARDAVFATIGYPRRAIAAGRRIRGVRRHPHWPWPILDDAWLAEGE